MTESEKNGGYGYYILFIVHLILSNTSLNVFIGLFGGIMINVYTSQPKNNPYFWALGSFLLAICFSFYLMYANERIARFREVNSSQKPDKSMDYALDALGSKHKFFYPLGMTSYVLFIVIGMILFVETANRVSNLEALEEDVKNSPPTKRIIELNTIIAEKDNQIKLLTDSVLKKLSGVDKGGLTDKKKNKSKVAGLDEKRYLVPIKHKE